MRPDTKRRSPLPLIFASALALLFIFQLSLNVWCSGHKRTWEIERLMMEHAAEVERIQRIVPDGGPSIGEATPTPWWRFAPRCSEKGVMTIVYQNEGQKKLIIEEVLGGREDFHGVRIRWMNT